MTCDAPAVSGEHCGERWLDAFYVYVDAPMHLLADAATLPEGPAYDAARVDALCVALRVRGARCLEAELMRRVLCIAIDESTPEAVRCDALQLLESGRHSDLVVAVLSARLDEEVWLLELARLHAKAVPETELERALAGLSEQERIGFLETRSGQLRDRPRPQTDRARPRTRVPLTERSDMNIWLFVFFVGWLLIRYGSC